MRGLMHGVAILGTGEQQHSAASPPAFTSRAHLAILLSDGRCAAAQTSSIAATHAVDTFPPTCARLRRKAGSSSDPSLAISAAASSAMPSFSSARMVQVPTRSAVAVLVAVVARARCTTSRQRPCKWRVGVMQEGGKMAIERWRRQWRRRRRRQEDGSGPAAQALGGLQRPQARALCAALAAARPRAAAGTAGAAGGPWRRLPVLWITFCVLQKQLWATIVSSAAAWGEMRAVKMQVGLPVALCGQFQTAHRDRKL